MNLALIIEAIVELQRRKLRTGLTLLGMVFGVGAIVAMLAVGEGSKREALRLVSELGLNNVLLEAKSLTPDRLKDIRTRSLGLSAADGAAALSVVPGAESVSFKKEIKVDQLARGATVATATAFAVSPGYAEHSGVRVSHGRWFAAEDGATLAPVAVLGSRLAKTLFGDAEAVGSRIKLNHQWLEVIGVLADRAAGKSEFEGVKLGLDDERLFVPWETGRARFRFTLIEDEVDGISLRLDGKSPPDVAARVLQTLIEQRHGGEEDSNLIVPMGLYRQHQQTQRIFTVVMSSIAAVSLLVGGIGIMNIMLASVLERIKEIGVRRSLGARETDIVLQFLFEAVIISLLGGVIGVGLGVLSAKLIASAADIPTVISTWSIALSFGVAATIGLVFGIFPARKAAKEDPIKALRIE